jgi:ribonucleoside-diphosphate reductase alpha chain
MNKHLIAGREDGPGLYEPRPIRPPRNASGDTGRQRLIDLGKDADQQERFSHLFDRGFVPDLRLREATQSGGPRILLDGFVQPIGDSLIDADGQGRPGIMSALAQAAQVFGEGVAISIDFSQLRPAGSRVGSTGCEAAGPSAYIGLFDSLRGTVQAPGGDLVPFTAVLRADHPDIELFVRDCAETSVDGAVAINDATMGALRGGEGVDPARALAVASRDAQVVAGLPQAILTPCLADLWHLLFDQGGDSVALVFPDTANRRNSLRYCEQLHVPIHPGGPLLPFHGACAGGTLMLQAFVAKPGAHAAGFDWPSFGRAIADAVEFLDRAVDLVACPLPEQQVELQNKRRIALSCAGLAQALARLGLLPGSAEGLAFRRELWTVMRDGAFLSSVHLARAQGAFQLFNADGYLRPDGFSSTLAPGLQDVIRQHGVRNASLLSAAVTVGEDGDCTDLDVGLALLESIAPLVDGGVGLWLLDPSAWTADQLADTVMRAWQAGANGVRIGH